MSELLTTEEVAGLSRRHVDTVLTAARHECLASIQSAARGPRKYWRKDVIEWINRGAPYQKPAGKRARIARVA